VQISNFSPALIRIQKPEDSSNEFLQGELVFGFVSLNFWLMHCNRAASWTSSCCFLPSWTATGSLVFWQHHTT
jgi:hypothetical protein